MKHIQNAGRDPDVQAFLALYDRYYPAVRQYITLLRIPGEEDPDDIVQDVFLSLWQRRQNLAEIGSPANYLFCMVRNRLINEREKKSTRRRCSDELREHAGTRALATQEQIDFRETRRLLQQGVRSLPPRARLAYTLRELEGWKPDEIARAMGVSKSVAKQHLQTATKKIRSFMKAFAQP
ncbi:MAG TPA: sigma-70 family RNA polymerase sigma factor [Puia sp.]|jgi:RNA polymerase sigma-70 factor (family 1)|nr:sigma-70 family RNA polymerase sigma factor [Puia sp.]